MVLLKELFKTVLPPSRLRLSAQQGITFTRLHGGAHGGAMYSPGVMVKAALDELGIGEYWTKSAV
eukprot:4716270-Heterocapsa_arctica.AAC.1